MRIAFAALDTFSIKGGIQAFNQRLMLALTQLAADGDIASLPSVIVLGAPPADRAAVEGIELVCRSSHTGFLRSCASAFRSCDVLILGHINLLPLVLIARLLNRRMHVALVVHGDEVWNSSAHRKRRFYEPSLLRLVDRIASVSSFTADVIKREFGVREDQIFPFLNAVDLKQASVSHNPDPRILCVTRLTIGEERKNVDKLLYAMVGVLQVIPHASLEIVGRGQLTDDLAHLAETLGIAKSVVFHGGVEDAQLEAMYRAASVFALPSDKEGFGIVYLEAWSYALPVIASRNGAPATFIEHMVDGYLVDPDEIGMLSQVMIDCLQSRRQRQTLGANGLRKVTQQFSHAAFVARLRTLLTMPKRLPL